MNFKIGQLRKNQINSYSSKIDYNLILSENENSMISFYDPCISLSGTNIVSHLYSYYLRFEVTQLTNCVQNFTIKLKNSELIEDNVQQIRSFSVKQGIEKNVFELIFNPNSNYNEVIFELERLALDFNLDNKDGTSGRIMDIKILDFYIIDNIIEKYLSQAFSGLTSLKKIGIQGQPGLLFVLDGEEIRIGRSGIYELYNENINISYIGFVIKDSSLTQDKEDSFIMDFRY